MVCCCCPPSWLPYRALLYCQINPVEPPSNLATGGCSLASHSFTRNILNLVVSRLLTWRTPPPSSSYRHGNERRPCPQSHAVCSPRSWRLALSLESPPARPVSHQQGEVCECCCFSSHWSNMCKLPKRMAGRGCVGGFNAWNIALVDVNEFGQL